MKENIYDNSLFFEKYSEMLRSQKGLEGAGEWPVLEKMLPDFKGKRVLDLGCGYGWHCMYAVAKGASKVLGIDLSKKMLEEAKRRNNFDNVEYVQAGIEDFTYPKESYDIVISSLAFHYVENLKEIFKKVYHTLARNGDFIFTIEHPIFTAYGSQEWFYNDKGLPIHWPVDNYFIEGKRESSFLGERVIKYHHTLTAIFQALLQNNFLIKEVVEPQPTKEMLDTIPAMKEELRRPMMLAISTVKREFY